MGSSCQSGSSHMMGHHGLIAQCHLWTELLAPVRKPPPPLLYFPHIITTACCFCLFAVGAAGGSSSRGLSFKISLYLMAHLHLCLVVLVFLFTLGNSLVPVIRVYSIKSVANV